VWCVSIRGCCIGSSRRFACASAFFDFPGNSIPCYLVISILVLLADFIVSVWFSYSRHALLYLNFVGIGSLC
jgi:hypothetical protein